MMRNDYVTMGSLQSPRVSDPPRGGHRPTVLWFAPRVVLPLVLLTGAVLTTRSAKADITYNLVNYPGSDSNGVSIQNGNTVSGTITTDGKTGTLSQSDILAWSITVNTTTFTSADSGATTTLTGNIEANTTQITLPIGDSSSPFLSLGAGNAFLLWEWSAFTGAFNYQGFASNASQWDYQPFPFPTSGTWVIADGGTPSGVPEPAAAVLASIGAVAAFLAHGWSHHRRAQRRRPTA